MRGYRLIRTFKNPQYLHFLEIVKDFQFFICWRYTFWSPRTKESRKKCKNSGLKRHVFERFLFGHASNALYCNILFPVPNSLRKKSRQVLVSLPKHINHTKHLLESIKTQIIQIQLLLSFISTVLTSSIIHSRKKIVFSFFLKSNTLHVYFPFHNEYNGIILKFVYLL